MSLGVSWGRYSRLGEGSSPGPKMLIYPKERQRLKSWRCVLYPLPHLCPWHLSLQSRSLGALGRSQCNLGESHTSCQMFSAAVLGTMDLVLSREGETTGHMKGIGAGIS